MATFVFIIIAVFILLILSGKENKTSKRNSTINQGRAKKSDKQLQDETINELLKNIQVKVTTSYSNTSSSEDSIIDVTGQSQALNLNNQTTTLVRYDSGVPFWKHQYVYSFNEIKAATKEQIDFYNQFKYRFLKGQYLDLEGNSNYSFILLFDLLNDYELNNNKLLLERQIEEIAKYYPKTKSYAISLLIKKLETAGDNEAIARVRSKQYASYQYNPSYSGYSFEGNYWGIGTKYKAKLQLKDDEVKHLNKLVYSGNNFCTIEYCFIEVIKVYLSAIEELNTKFTQQGQKLDDLINTVADVILQKHFKYKYGSNNYSYGMDSVVNEIYTNIFKRCENLVREYYNHKRKINTETFYTAPEAKSALETKILNPLEEILPTLISLIKLPDEATEIELFSQNTNRWKIKFEELTAAYKVGNGKQFMDSILQLGNLNKRNPSVENIFFEASKFIAKTDKETSLTLYVYYLHYDLKSVYFDNKQLTKTIQKSLFKTNEQLHDFEIIVNELVADKDLDKALTAASKLYLQKRKKIQLDSKSILEVQQQHSGTVELLNEYLKDEHEDQVSTIKTQEISTDEIKIEITQRTDTPPKSLYLTAFQFTQAQTAALEMFAKNNFTIEQSELEGFAKSNGVFTNQLVESINEKCYDNLDDILIEEEDEYFIINPNYYQRLLTI